MNLHDLPCTDVPQSFSLSPSLNYIKKKKNFIYKHTNILMRKLAVQLDDTRSNLIPPFPLTI